MDRRFRDGQTGTILQRLRGLTALRVTLYAGNACFFLLLSAVPALLLIPGLLRGAGLTPAQLGELLRGLLPEAFRKGVQDVMTLVSEHASGTAVGISAVTALWSASRGMSGILTGLNAVYGVSKGRGWLHTRILSVGYTIVFLAGMLAALGLSSFGSALLALPGGAEGTRGIPGRILPAVLQTGLFAAMYMVLPDRPNGFGESLPGAVFSWGGWMLVSRGYSLYVTRFARLTDVYGSVSALVLGMLWLYWCLCIFFYGGALNVAVRNRRKNMTEP